MSWTGSAAATPRRARTKGDDITVGLLLPEKANTRYEKFDYPIIEQQVAKLTDDKGAGRLRQRGSERHEQSQQFRQMVADKVDVILVDAVDSKAIASDVQKAKDAGIPVIAYDRLAQGPIDAYISFDNELVGQVQGKALLEALGAERLLEEKIIVMMNGSPTDPNAAQFKSGALGELNGKVVISKTYDHQGLGPGRRQGQHGEGHLGHRPQQHRRCLLPPTTASRAPSSTP